jgi:HPt (histidine-containing phosphotransfer) domain-containing protein
MRTPLFDPSLLEDWKDDDLQHWQETVRSVLEAFFATADKRRALLDDALARGDWAALNVEAHALKSSCGSIGACGAHRLLQQIENACAGKGRAVATPTEMSQLLAEFNLIFDQSLVLLADYVRNLKVA